MQESSKITSNQSKVCEKDQSFDVYLTIIMRISKIIYGNNDNSETTAKNQEHPYNRETMYLESFQTMTTLHYKR